MNNVGEERGGYTVELVLDGVVVESVETPDLGDGMAVTVIFDLTSGEGTYQVEVEDLTGSFTVKPKPFWDKIPGFPYESIILGLIAVIIILWYARARKF